MVAPVFDFLKADGFRLVAVEPKRKPTIPLGRCRYVAPHVAVDLEWSREFGRADAFIIELDAGEVPPYPIFITADAPSGGSTSCNSPGCAIPSWRTR